MGDLFTILGCVLLLFVIGLLAAVYFPRSWDRSRRTVKDWAAANDYELLSCNADLSGLILEETGRLSHKVTLRRSDGTEARALVTTGSLLGGPRDEVRVAWEK